MRESLLIRFSDHQDIEGVHEYSVETSIPGRYSNVVVGASQAELMTQLIPVFEQVFTLLEIPMTVQRMLADLAEPVENAPMFTDSEGKPIPVSGFAATAKASFSAEVIRNGRVLSDEEASVPLVES